VVARATPSIAAPPLLATTLHSGEVVGAYRQYLSGQTEPGARVQVDGRDAAVTRSGRFIAEPFFNTPGENRVCVTATTAGGRSTSRMITYSFVPPPGWAAAIGDSVMLGAKAEIEKRLGEGVVDAAVSRQFLTAPGLVAELMARPSPPQLLIIGLGTNGPVQRRHFDEVMRLAAKVPLVLFINVRVPRSWEGTSNREIEEGVARYDNAELVDWFEATRNRGDLFGKDGVHPRQAGRVLLAELIAAAAFPKWVPLGERGGARLDARPGGTPVISPSDRFAEQGLREARRCRRRGIDQPHSGCGC